MVIIQRKKVFSTLVNKTDKHLKENLTLLTYYEHVTKALIILVFILPKFLNSHYYPTLNNIYYIFSIYFLGRTT